MSTSTRTNLETQEVLNQSFDPATGSLRSGVVASTDEQVLNPALTTTPSAITFTQAVKAFSIQARTGVDLQFRRLSGDANYFTIKSGTVASFSVSSPSVTVGYLSTASGSATGEVIGLY